MFPVGSVNGSIKIVIFIAVIVFSLQAVTHLWKSWSNKYYIRKQDLYSITSACEPYTNTVLRKISSTNCTINKRMEHQIRTHHTPTMSRKRMICFLFCPALVFTALWLKQTSSEIINEIINDLTSYSDGFVLTDVWKTTKINILLVDETLCTIN